MRPQLPNETRVQLKCSSSRWETEKDLKGAHSFSLAWAFTLTSDPQTILYTMKREEVAARRI